MSTRTSRRPPKFGVIDQTHFTLITPRSCDDGGFDLLEDAFTAAFVLVDDGATEVAIVQVEYDLESGLWREIPNGITIEIDASNWKFNEDDEQEH